MSRNAWLVVALAATVGCKIDNTVFEQTQYDSWAQAPNNEVDILWVIDDSASMLEEQTTLIRGFTSFAGQLENSGADFQIGVITTSFDETDPDRGVLIGDPPFLTPLDDYETEFANRAQVGVSGSDKEKGLEAATFAVHPSMTLGGPNDGFVRNDAQLLIVFVTDEEDCSDKGALSGQTSETCYTQPEKLEPISTYVQDFRQLKADASKVQVGAIVGIPGSTCPDVYQGRRYIQVAAYTGGFVGDICQSDWSNMLGELGLNASGIRSQFQLTKAAVPETIAVFVDDEKIKEDAANGWTYDETTWFITFHGDSVPPRGSTVGAEYTVQPGVPEPSGTGT